MANNRSERSSEYVKNYGLDSMQAAAISNNRKLAKITAVRVSNHIARRLGAFYQGMHWTGLKVDRDDDDRLLQILDQRRACEDFILNKLRDPELAALAIACCQISDPVRVLGCGAVHGAAYECAYLSDSGRRRLYQCLMLLGRVESWLWFIDHNFTAEAARDVLNRDSDWRKICKSLVPRSDLPVHHAHVIRLKQEFQQNCSPPIINTDPKLL